MPNPLHFGEGVMWAAIARIGYRWQIGDGKQVKFWEDNWLASATLAVLF